MTVFEALMLCVTFASLIVLVLSEQKNNHPMVSFAKHLG